MIKNPTSIATEDKRNDLLIRVASMYYERDYSQQKIADILNISSEKNMSRSNVSRLLKEAREKGFVEIRVHKQFPTEPELENALVEAFGVTDALVLESNGADYDARLEQVGQLAALHLSRVIGEGDSIGIAWGTGVASAVSAFPLMPANGNDVVQMLGTVGNVDSVLDGPELARELATKLGGQHYHMHAPLFVDSPAARDIFIQQTAIAEALRRARAVKAALVGIGTTVRGRSSFLRAGHLTEDELETLREAGAVGESAGQHFDMDDGNYLTVTP
ncbi:MAG: sugar-binding domain-containing protein [Chloroflexota bacterium]